MPRLPVISRPWSAAKRIVDPLALTPKPGGPLPRPIWVNDFCIAKDADGRWHCIGILSDMGASELFHVVADDIVGPYREMERISSGVGDVPRLDMWAPFVIRRDSNHALLFYAHLQPDVPPGVPAAAIRMLTADAQMNEWRPRGDPLMGENVVFAEHHARDPQVFFDDSLSCYLMYYVVGDGWTDRESDNVVRVRTSTDLHHWSEPRTVLAPPPGYRAAESVFVLRRDDIYYLWLSGFDYGLMSLYASEDPFCFGDPVANRLIETSGHAPEIVTSDGVDWIACVAVSSTPGQSPAWHDLPGVMIQPLEWIDMPVDLQARIHRNAASSTEAG